MPANKDAGAVNKQLDDILCRGVGSFIDPNDSFRKKVIAKAMGEYAEDITVKFGVDPTRPDIHLGHAVILHKLRQLQDLGCKIVFLIGDITAQIGDPTGRSKVRPEVEQEAIQYNLNTYLDQIGKIIPVDRDKETKKIFHTKRFSWIKNSDWYVGVTDLAFAPHTKANIRGFSTSGEEKTLSVDSNSFIGKAALYNHQFSMQINELGRPTALSVSLLNVLSIVRNISYAQLIERDMFQERIKADEPLYMHEMLYPVLQGIDSKVLHGIYGSCDLEIGGTDQTFNMLMGRKIMDMSQQEPQAVLACSLLTGLDGKEKMSKSLDNYICITDDPSNMFGKIMSIPDHLIIDYFILCTFAWHEAIEDISNAITKGKMNPKDAKMDLAQQVVEIYYGADAASAAKEAFIHTFQKKEIPTDMPSIQTHKDTPLGDLLVSEKIIASKSEFRRLVDEGAVRLNGEIKIDDPAIKVQKTEVYKIGKHRFVKIVVS